MGYQDRITVEAEKKRREALYSEYEDYDVLNMLPNGESNENILLDFPELEDIQACLVFTADRERKVKGLRVA